MSEIPQVLLQCFTDLDFISGVGDNEKICFGRRQYVSKDSWSGCFIRFYGNESMETTGVLKLKEICLMSAQCYLTFKNKNNFGDAIMEKIINARKGLTRLKLTYDSIDKTIVGSKINSTCIFILDSVIPYSERKQNGFILDKIISNDSDVERILIDDEHNSLEEEEI